MCLGTTYVPRARGGQETASDPLELEFRDGYEQLVKTEHLSSPGLLKHLNVYLVYVSGVLWSVWRSEDNLQKPLLPLLEN